MAVSGQQGGERAHRLSVSSQGVRKEKLNSL